MVSKMDMGYKITKKITNTKTRDYRYLKYQLESEVIQETQKI